MDELASADARADFTELLNRVRLLRKPVLITRRSKPQAAIVPVELADAAEIAGGMDKAAEILRRSVARKVT